MQTLSYKDYEVEAMALSSELVQAGILWGAALTGAGLYRVRGPGLAKHGWLVDLPAATAPAAR